MRCRAPACAVRAPRRLRVKVLMAGRGIQARCRVGGEGRQPSDVGGSVHPVLRNVSHELGIADRWEPGGPQWQAVSGVGQAGRNTFHSPRSICSGRCTAVGGSLGKQGFAIHNGCGAWAGRLGMHALTGRRAWGHSSWGARRCARTKAFCFSPLQVLANRRDGLL